MRRPGQSSESCCLDAIQRGLRICGLVAPGGGRRRRHIPAGSCGQKSPSLGQGKIVSVVRGLNAAQKVLILDGRKAELRSAVSGFLRLREKQNHVGMILNVDEKQNSRFLIAEASDLVFSGRMRLAAGYE